jgi:PAS domain S-box-containing protein
MENMFFTMKKISFRNFFIIYLLLAVTLPLLVLGFMSVFFSARTLWEELSRANQVEVQLVEKMVQDYIEAPSEDLNLIKHYIGSREKGKTQLQGIEKILASLTDTHDYIQGVQIASDKGEVLTLYPYNEMKVGTDISGFEYFFKVMQIKGNYWAPSILSEQFNYPVTSLSTLYNGHVITLFLSLEGINDGVSRLQRENSGEVLTLSDQRGVFIAHTDKKKVRLREYDPFFHEIGHQNGEKVFNLDGQKFFYYSKSILENGWKISLLKPLSSIRMPVEMIVKWIVLITLTIVAVTLLIGRKLSKCITSSLSRIIDSTRLISKGNYLLTIPDVMFAELIELSRSFSSMAKEVEGREKELKKAENYITNIIDSMPSALVGVDVNLNITLWNKEAERLSGVKSDDAKGIHIDKVLPHLREEKDYIKKAMSTGEQQIDSNRYVVVGKNKYYEDVVIYPLINSENPGAVIRLDNVSERVKIEEIMMQSEKMMSLGGLAAGIAHEINNPLAGMIQTAGTLKNRLSNPKLASNIKTAEEVGISFDKLQDYLKARDSLSMMDNIVIAGHRAAEIVANMLNFVRNENDIRSTHCLSEVLLSTLEIAGTDFDLKKRFDFRQIQITHEFDENLPEIPCDAGRLQQVILNILKNGAEAMQEWQTECYKQGMECEDPKFVIRIKNLVEEKAVGIEIEDNGPGMDESVRKRIFEPFFTTKDVGVGTGLGLSVSYFIISKIHNGELFVESTKGKGTKFVMKLPVVN